MEGLPLSSVVLRFDSVGDLPAHVILEGGYVDRPAGMLPEAGYQGYVARVKVRADYLEEFYAELEAGIADPDSSEFFGLFSMATKSISPHDIILRKDKESVFIFLPNPNLQYLDVDLDASLTIRTSSDRYLEHLRNSQFSDALQGVQVKMVGQARKITAIIKQNMPWVYVPPFKHCNLEVDMRSNLGRADQMLGDILGPAILTLREFEDCFLDKHAGKIEELQIGIVNKGRIFLEVKANCDILRLLDK